MVADFGIALAVSAAAGGRMTETGLSLGTPHYMSPEQATAEKEITGRSDIYSLAAVLYEMLAGHPPHTGASAQQIVMKIVTEEPAPVTRDAEVGAAERRRRPWPRRWRSCRPTGSPAPPSSPGRWPTRSGPASRPGSRGRSPAARRPGCVTPRSAGSAPRSSPWGLPSCPGPAPRHARPHPCSASASICRRPPISAAPLQPPGCRRTAGVSSFRP